MSQKQTATFRVRQMSYPRWNRLSNMYRGIEGVKKGKVVHWGTDIARIPVPIRKSRSRQLDHHGLRTEARSHEVGRVSAAIPTSTINTVAVPCLMVVLRRVGRRAVGG